MDKVRYEVAKKVFSTIEKILKFKKKIEIERRDVYKNSKYPMFSYLDELDGRIYGYSVIEEQTAELKKKYGVKDDDKKV